MLREIKGVAQTRQGFRRRWFEGEYFDLFTWQDAGGAYTSFQLCYDVQRRERAFKTLRRQCRLRERCLGGSLCMHE